MSSVARLLGVSRSTIYNYVPEFQHDKAETIDALPLRKRKACSLIGAPGRAPPPSAGEAEVYRFWWPKTGLRDISAYPGARLTEDAFWLQSRLQYLGGRPRLPGSSLNISPHCGQSR